ncbi:MAG TPA: hypothetical protein VMY39_02830, partial [Planctomycetota bacterium]|nr:hypothetical protein [Planctomycetota bacterium]
METLRSFFTGYWEMCRYYLVAIGVLYLIILIPFRQPGKALAALVVGLYATLSVYFLSVYRQLGFEQEWALGVVIVIGLALCGLFYYAFFIR